jgi:N-acetylglutamate synthase-like GNAT family acetyltransferase
MAERKARRRRFRRENIALDWQDSLNDRELPSRQGKRVGAMIDTPDHSIRVATPADFDAVGALLAASYSSLLAGDYDRDTLTRAVPILTKPNPTLLASGTYYVAESEPDNLVGCGGWATKGPRSDVVVDGEAHIRHFATHPAWVERGVATSLLARCFSDARRSGIRKLHCISSLNAEAFYRASGFDTVEPMDLPLEPGLTIRCVLMSRALA